MKKQIAFQGNLQKKQYFEGYYYKQVSKSGKETIAVIVGISTDEKHPHAFIQINENINLKSYYLEYPLSKFTINKDPFSISLENNYFTEDRMILDIDREEIKIKANLFFNEQTPLLSTLYRPTIMGPFSYLKMQCNHGIISLKHTIKGKIHLLNQEVDFTEGTGYIEKDYGTSFPKNYVWASSNHSQNSADTFFLSVAHIPILKTSFTGIICVLLKGEKQYYFTSYYGCRVKKIEKKKKQVKMTLKQGSYIIDLTLKYKNKNSLLAPMKGSMEKTIEESLNGTIHIKIVKKKKLWYENTFTNSGLEIV